MTSAAPSAANPRAMPLPMPLLPPVTRATLPWSLVIMIWLSFFAPLTWKKHPLARALAIRPAYHDKGCCRFPAEAPKAFLHRKQPGSTGIGRGVADPREQKITAKTLRAPRQRQQE